MSPASFPQLWHGLPRRDQIPAVWSWSARSLVRTSQASPPAPLGTFPRLPCSGSTPQNHQRTSSIALSPDNSFGRLARTTDPAYSASTHSRAGGRSPRPELCLSRRSEALLLLSLRL